MRLETLVRRAAARTPDAPAVRAPDGQATYGELDRMADALAGALIERGVQPGDRVGIWIDKGLRAIAVMQAVLRCGAAYVPMDPRSPVARLQRIVDSCRPRVIATTTARASRLEYAGQVLLTDALPVASGHPAALPSRMHLEGPTHPEDLAYILFTSGSTGEPKGVCISHRNALAFVEWAVAATAATSADRFSSFAPFHFDLSVFDLYACFAVGGRVSVASEMLSLAPARVITFVREEQISVWYSVPSLLILAGRAGLLDAPSLEPRVVIFAGEPYPLDALVRLRTAWGNARMFNWYGPTETNVCTSYELPRGQVPARAVPIGGAASEAILEVRTDDGAIATVGQEGELHVTGPTVMLGYWPDPIPTRRYPTGDRVRVVSDGQLAYLGRRDGMLKIHGNRVEAAEVEAALRQHPEVRDAVVMVVGDGPSAVLVAGLVAAVSDAPQPSLLALKRVCARHVPAYMMVDRVVWLEQLPLGRNGKRDTRTAHSRIIEQL